MVGNITKLLEQAKGALEKLVRDSLKILKDNADCLDENGASLKKHYSQAQNDLNLINHVMTFHELPDSPGSITKDVFDKKVYQVAQHVEALNQEIEVSRAKVKAKKN